MPATVSNNLILKLSAPSPAQPLKSTDAATGETFTKHLEDARDAARATPDRELKPARAHAASGKGAKKARPDAVRNPDEQPADESTADAPADPAALNPSSPVDGEPVDLPAKESKPTLAARSESTSGDLTATLVPPTPAQPAQLPTAIKAQDRSPSDPAAPPATPIITAVDASTTVANAPDVDAQAKAEETAAAFEASQSKAASPKIALSASPLDEPPAVNVKATIAKSPAPSTIAPIAAADDAALPAAPVPPQFATPPEKSDPSTASDGTRAQWMPGGVQPVHSQAAGHAPAASVEPPLPPELHFADANHASIVSGVQANLLPHGGTMQIRLDPPELGALQVTVEMRDGSLSATFQTSNEDATRLLSHSLSQLKTALESQGVTVDKIQVQQAPKNQHSQAQEEPSQQQQQRDEANARQEQQRRELLQRMWRRVSGGEPMDLVA